jgi:hypothetical protein
MRKRTYLPLNPTNEEVYLPLNPTNEEACTCKPGLLQNVPARRIVLIQGLFIKNGDIFYTFFAHMHGRKYSGQFAGAKYECKKCHTENGVYPLEINGNSR